MRMFESSDVVPVSGEKDRKGTTRSLFRVTEYSFDTAKSVSTVQVFRLSSTQVFRVERSFHCLLWRGGCGEGGLGNSCRSSGTQETVSEAVEGYFTPHPLFGCSSVLCMESTVVPQNVYEYEIIRPIRFVEKSSVVCLDMEPKLPLPIGGSCVKHGGT